MDPKKKAGKPEKHLKWNFKPLFEKSEMTRAAFAAETGMDYTTVGDLINGNYRRVGLETLEKICITLNCDVGDLFVWE